MKTGQCGWILVVVAANLGGGCGSSSNNAHQDMSMDLAAAGDDLARAESDSAVPGDASIKDAAVDLSSKDAGPSFADGGVTGAYVYTATNPGSGGGVIFTITIDHDANTALVSAADATAPFTISGSFETLASGFLKINITKGCNGNACAPAVIASVNTPGGGSITLPTPVHAIEAPGYWFLLQPDSGSGAIAGVAQQNSCLAAMFGAYNAIPVGDSNNVNIQTGDAYELLTLGGGNTASPAPGITNFTIDGTASPQPSPSPGACSQGQISFNGGAAANGATVLESGSRGVLLVNDPQGDDRATIALVQNAITLANLENHTYSGFGFSQGNNNSPTQYVTMTLGGSATGTGTKYLTLDSVDTNTPDPDAADGATFTFTGVTNGLVSGTLSGGATGKFKGAALQAGGVNFLVLIVELNNDGTQILNLILTSHP